MTYSPAWLERLWDDGIQLEDSCDAEVPGQLELTNAALRAGADPGRIHFTRPRGHAKGLTL